MSTTNINLQSLLENFNFVTVMNACVRTIQNGGRYGLKALEPADLNSSHLYLDTLKISNIEESGPIKAFNIGAYNIPAIRFGKKTTMRIEDALGKAQELEDFFGLKVLKNEEDNIIALYNNDGFSKPVAIDGEIKVINIQGQLETIYIFIPFLLPDGHLNITLDAAGDFGIFNLGGQLFPTKIQFGNEQYTCKYIISTAPFGNDHNIDVAKTPIYSGDFVDLQGYNAANDSYILVADPTMRVRENDGVLFISPYSSWEI